MRILASVMLAVAVCLLNDRRRRRRRRNDPDDVDYADLGDDETSPLAPPRADLESPDA